MWSLFCPISVKAGPERDSSMSINVYRSVPIILLFLSSLILSLAPSPFPSLHLPLSLCVAYCETDGEGKDDRQTEGGRDQEAENDQVGKRETITRRWEKEKQRGSRCVKHKRPCGVCDSFLAGSDQTPPIALTEHIRGWATPLVSYPGHPILLISSPIKACLCM